jgi:predicted enzyme related to lactoylglutathione lyase
VDKVVHFEIPIENVERAKDFYKKVFIWKLNNYPKMDYTIIHTVKVDDKFIK